jgi:hypothetical protein
LSKASLNLKRALWGDKPEGLLPENCPNFSFFFVWAGSSPEKGGYFNYEPTFTEVFSGKIYKRFF